MIVNDRRLLGRGSGSRRLGRVAGAVCVAIALALGHGRRAGRRPGVPTEIQVLAGNKLFLEAHATGVQSYDCVAVADGYAWSAPTPRANLYADNGKLVATHYGGPDVGSQGRQQGGGPEGGGSDPRPHRDPMAAAGRRLDQRRARRRPPRPHDVHPADRDRRRPPARRRRLHRRTAGARKEIPYAADYRFWKAA